MNDAEWFDIKKELPPEPKDILEYYLCNIYCAYQRGESSKGNSIQICAYWAGQGFKFNGGEAKITHWMPLPDFPELESPELLGKGGVE